MPRYKLTIEYDGTQYAGWQKQPDMPSVQQALEEAAFKFCGAEVEVIGAGRTDAGVHATAQVAHVDLPKAYDPFRVLNGINFYLFDPAGKTENDEEGAPPVNRISVLSAEEVSDEFHARFSATRRYYRYEIINRRPRLAIEAGRAWRVVEPLDADAMHEAAKRLLGTHDFTSFRDSKCQAKSPIKTLDRLDVMRHGDKVVVETNARSYLHHQVRIMVGSLTMVGKGKWNMHDVETALAAKIRAAAGPTAPPEGLYLMQVDYE